MDCGRMGSRAYSTCKSHNERACSTTETCTASLGSGHWALGVLEVVRLNCTSMWGRPYQSSTTGSCEFAGWIRYLHICRVTRALNYSLHRQTNVVMLLSFILSFFAQCQLEVTLHTCIGGR